MKVLLLFLLCVPFVTGAASHQIDGDTVTFDFQGTPPFMLNIRADQDIGAPGGFVWVSAFQNKYSLNMAFAKNSAMTFYYGSKDQGSSWSTGSFNLGQSTSNVKNRGAYTAKTVFVVSDDWRETLTYIPVAVWTENGQVEKYPLLIPHIEQNAFDADSIKWFITQYQPSDILYAGIPQNIQTVIGAGMTAKKAEDYWISYHDVVLSKNDYNTAMLSSTYASLINAPLFIQGYNDNIDLSGKNVVCVEITDPRCSRSSTLDALQAEYLSLTNTDKIIVTNPSGEHVVDTKITENGGTITRLFQNTAISAPILASAKHELLLFTDASDIDKTDQRLKQDTRTLGASPGYLTIIASPKEITQTIAIQRPGSASILHWSVDNTRYGNIDSDSEGYAELKTGRIYGFSTSDVSSYIARVLFYDTLPKGNKILVVGQGVSNDEDVGVLASVLREKQYVVDVRNYSSPAKPADYLGRFFIYNGAHGGPYGSVFGTENVPWMQDPVILEGSCLTCAFDSLTSQNYGRLFCAEELRKGSVGIVASVDTAGFDWHVLRTNRALSEDLGTGARARQNIDHARQHWYETQFGDTDSAPFKGDIQFLLGDPTFKLPSSDGFLPSSKTTIVSSTSENILADVTVPSIKLLNGKTYLMTEGSESHAEITPDIPIRLIIRAGPLPISEKYKVNATGIDPFFFNGLMDLGARTEDGGKYLYLMIEKNMNDTPPNIVASSKIQLNITRDQ